MKLDNTNEIKNNLFKYNYMFLKLKILNIFLDFCTKTLDIQIL